MGKLKCVIFNRTDSPKTLEEDVNIFLQNNDIEIVQYKQSSTGRMDTTVTISIIYKENSEVSL